MRCQQCQQRPASLHFTKIINGQKTEMHLCDQCAKERGEAVPGLNNGFSIHNLLSGLLSFDAPGGAASSPYHQPVRCDRCGLTYNQFSKSGRFGCAHCYRVFADRLEPLFRKVHGGHTVHQGKIPRRTGSRLQLKREIERKKEELKRAVSREEFELAARLRDEIRYLEQKGLTE